MSAYISDGTLMMCQRLLMLNLELLNTFGADKKLIDDCLDEINAGLAGTTVEEERSARIEMEKKNEFPF
jgi:hypothetical protein